MNCWMGERTHAQYLIPAVALHSTCWCNNLLGYVGAVCLDSHFVQQGLLLPSEIKKVTLKHGLQLSLPPLSEVEGVDDRTWILEGAAQESFLCLPF